MSKEKDPAFLFYSSDFITGTLMMSNEEVGKYIKLLCVQHQHGGLIEKDYFNSFVGDSVLIRKKFLEIEEGFYNERLYKEMLKRKDKSNSLSANAKKRWDKDIQKQYKSNAKASDLHSGLHMPIDYDNEDVNRDIKEDKRIVKERRGFIKPTIEQVRAYCVERKNSVNPEKWMNHYEANGWMVGKNKMSDWKASVRTWENSTINDGTPKRIVAPKRVVTKKCWKCEKEYHTDNESMQFCPECFKVVRAEQETKMQEIVRKAGK